MKIMRLCLGSAAIILSYSSQVSAGSPPGFDEWVLVDDTISSSNICAAGFTCGDVLTDTGFLQRMVTDTSSGGTYFQTIITENAPYISPFALPSEPVTTSLTCPSGFTCGATIVGFPNLQQEYTDGTSIWFQVAPATGVLEPDSPWIVTYGPTEPAPLHLFHTEDGLMLNLGPHQLSPIASVDDPSQPTLNQSQHFLLMSRDALATDPAYLELNQQSEAEQKIYRNVLDVAITGVTAGADVKLSAQLNTPLNIPDGYELHVRILRSEGWKDFVSDDHNYLAAAAMLESGFCPEVGSPLYQTAFSAGSECLQLTIQDGGPNDGDGNADGNVALTIGPVLKAIELEPTPVTDVEPVPTIGSVSQSVETADASTNPANDGGGGAWSWWMMLALLARLGRVRNIPTPSI